MLLMRCKSVDEEIRHRDCCVADNVGNTVTSPGYKILLVDDNPAQLETCAQVLKLRGFSVTVARDPYEALQCAVEAIETIDLIVVDYHMPGMNGCDLADRFLSISPNVKILLHSSSIEISAHEMSRIHGIVPKGDGIGVLLGEISRQLAAELRGVTSGTPRTSRDSEGEARHLRTVPRGPFAQRKEVA
jgi:CheY-like chemotaxis protein